MGLHSKLPEGLCEVDIIIAGGGTAGCVVASRLADADPELSILMVEGGPNNDSPTIAFPALFLANLMPDSKYVLFYQSVSEENLAGRQSIVTSGGCLGGGSSLNFMMYSRGHRSDFDAWQMPGWSADEILPYMKKFETYTGPGPKDEHGSDGPIQVSRGTHAGKVLEDDFIAVAAQRGWPEIEDLQALDANNGVSRAMRFISPDGKRQDVATCYLHPRLADGEHPNLHVLVQHQIVRVLFDDTKRAVGVEFKANPALQQEADSEVKSVRAREAVILSAGACGTPLILERSGVGDPEILKRAQVPVVENLPAVGQDYQDHQLAIYPYFSSLDPDQTIDDLVAGRINVGKAIQDGDKKLGWNAQDITVKIRPTEADVAALGRDFQQAWNRDFKDMPDKTLVQMGIVGGFGAGDPNTVPAGQYISTTVFNVHPYSRGHMHVTGPNANNPADFATGYFSDPHDLDIKIHMWGYKVQREMARRMQHYRGEVAAFHPPFAADSAAANIQTDAPLAKVVDIVYTPEDDAVLERWLREHIGTTWHSLGTAKMAPRDNNGVVDAQLSVYGVRDLKVADMSIVPGNMSANTNATALAIGEKAADIMKSELGLGK